VSEAAVGKRHAPALPGVFGTQLEAVLFDLDGVVTRTAAIHARAWKRLFDEFLAGPDDNPERFRPSRAPEDYLAYVDGKPRYEGAHSFCARAGSICRGAIPRIPPTTGPSAVWATARAGTSTRCWPRKGVKVFPTTLALIRALRTRGVRTASVSPRRTAGRCWSAPGSPICWT
jgi:beta-phosphoglucomutase-like phosphatase (HAD superfamily)